MATRKRQSSSGRKTKKERMQEMERAEEFRREIILWVIVAVSLLLFISNLGIGGKVGGAVSGFFFGLFGMIAYIFPIILLVGSFFGISNKDNAFAIVKLVAAILFSGVKVEAAVKFAESKPGRKALITLLEKARDGIAGKTGTVIHQ